MLTVGGIVSFVSLKHVLSLVSTNWPSGEGISLQLKRNHGKASLSAHAPRDVIATRARILIPSRQATVARDSNGNGHGRRMNMFKRNIEIIDQHPVLRYSLCLNFGLYKPTGIWQYKEMNGFLLCVESFVWHSYNVKKRNNYISLIGNLSKWSTRDNMSTGQITIARDVP